MRRISILIALLLLWPALPAWGEDDAVDLEGMNAFFDALRTAAESDDTGKLAALVDGDRILSYLKHNGFLEGMSGEQERKLRGRLPTALARGLVRNPWLGRIRSTEIRGVKPGDAAGTTVVYARHSLDEGEIVRTRWYLVSKGGAWRFFDLEDLDFGVRMLPLVGGLVTESMKGGSSDLLEGLESLMRANASLHEGEFEKAYEHLDEIQTDRLPGILQSMIEVLRSVASLGRAEFEQALAHARKAQARNADAPLLDYIRAACFNMLGDHEKALKHARMYIAALDEDPDVNLEVGRALHGLGRKAEAIAPLRKSVASEPVDYEAVAYLALCLPAEKRAEVTAHFEKLEDLDADFEGVADICVVAGDAGTLRFFVSLYAKKVPDHFHVPFYEGQAFLLEEKPAEAAARFEHALKILESVDMDPEDKEWYVESWLDAMIAQGKHALAFERSPDRVFAFRYLADDLVLEENAAVLMDLVSRAGAEEELLLDRRFYVAAAHFLRKKYADAVKILRPLRAEVNAKSPPDDVNEFTDLLWEIEDRLVRALVRIGGQALDEALAFALDIAKRDEDWDYAVIVYARRGQVKDALAAMEKAIEDEDSARLIFEDEDAATILSGEPYAEARAKYLPK